MTFHAAVAHSLGTMALVSLTSLSSPQCLFSADSVLCLKDGALQEVLSRVSYSKGRATTVKFILGHAGGWRRCYA